MEGIIRSSFLVVADHQNDYGEITDQEQREQGRSSQA